MKALSKYGLLLATALVACTAFAVGAQADHEVAEINPATTITGTASNPTLDYEGTEIVCPEGTATGTTQLGTNPVDVVNVELAFGPPGECLIAGSLAASVTCSTASGDNDEVGTARLHALSFDQGPTNPEQGEVDRLNTGFSCVVTVLGVCTVTVGAQDLTTNNDADLVGEGTGGDPTAINADVDVAATRTGSALCGPSSGTGGFTGSYVLDPDTVTFDQGPNG